MKNFSVLLSAFGGVAVFVYGLVKTGESSGILARGILGGAVSRAIKNPFISFIFGICLAGITQSGACVTVMAVGLAEAGKAALYNLAPLIIGANVGTTVTAQLVALTDGNVRLASIFAAVFSIVGVILFVCGKGGISVSGEALSGLGLMLFGITAVSARTGELVRLSVVRAVLGCDNPFLLFFGSFVFAAITQSSSALTGMLILLSENSAKAFYRAVFIILGSNVGSCLIVAFSGKGKCLAAKQTACFNFVFNLFGALLFLPAAIVFKPYIIKLFLRFSPDVGRAVANFQTAFNLVSALIAFPLSKPLTVLTEKGIEKLTVLNEMFNKKKF